MCDPVAKKGKPMPIHEYKCSDCGHVSELIVGIGRNSDDLTCSNCGSSKLEQLMSAASFSVSPTLPGPMGGGSTCCGGTPSSKGCTPGQCCGSS